MKALLATFIGMAVVSEAYGFDTTIGWFHFGNMDQYPNGGPLLVDIIGTTGVGKTGDYFGSEYNVSLYYSLTPISGKVDPLSLTLYPSTTTAFFGNTGSSPAHGPEEDGAGFFDGPDVNFPGTKDGQTIYTEVAVWYAGPGASSYESALELGYGAGYTSAVAIRLVSGPDFPVSDTTLPGLEINLIPEPSTVALCALGGAGLLLLRRRK